MKTRIPRMIRIAAMLLLVVFLASCTTVQTKTAEVPSASTPDGGGSSTPDSGGSSTPADPVIIEAPEDPAKALSPEFLSEIKGETVRVLVVKGYDETGRIERSVEVLKDKSARIKELFGVDLAVDGPLDANLTKETLKTGDYDLVMIQSTATIGKIAFIDENSTSFYPFEARLASLDERKIPNNLALDLFGTEVSFTLPYLSEPILAYLASEIDPAYAASLGVCFLNVGLFEEHKAEIAALGSSGGYSSPEELVEHGYWTMDLIADLCALFEQTEDGPSVFVPCGQSDAGFAARQADLFLAGSGLKTETLAGTVSVDEWTAINDYRSALDYDDNKELFDRFFALWKSSGKAVQSKDEFYDLFKNGKTLISFDALSAFDEKGLQNCATVMPLPLADHEQFDPDDPSLGYRTVMLQSENYLLAALPCDQGGSTAHKDRLPLVTAVLSELAYLGKTEVLPDVLKNLNETQKKTVALCRKDVFSDMTRSWSSDADYYTVFGDMSEAWNTDRDPSTVVKKWKQQHKELLRHLAAITAQGVV